MREVLVVDDDEDIRFLVSELLADEGYAVRTATNGCDALHMLAAWHPHLIVLDLAMPVMDGWTFIAAQRTDAALAQIPVLAISASQQLRAAGPPLDVAAQLCKPFTIDDLLCTVENLTRESGSDWRVAQCIARQPR